MLACTQGSAPEPTSEDVFLDDSPAQRFFVLSYPGFTSEVCSRLMLLLGSQQHGLRNFRAPVQWPHIPDAVTPLLSLIHMNT